MDTPRYKAFISYSHQDETWARWLQRSLETYRVPRRLVGQAGTYGPIPARLRPVFRDREDLSSASDLTAQIKDELDNAETLIVICSPAAARSPWVGEEIQYFTQPGRGDRILALIVEGEPQPTNTDEACFPPAILQAHDGSPKEPLAADVRKYADGKRLSLLKVIAGILGIRLDELRRRDAQRQIRSRLAYSISFVLLVSGIGWLAYSEHTTRAAAQAQRANTEELLGFMLGDLKRLAPIPGPEINTDEDPQQQGFRQQLGLADMDTEKLVANALDWRELGMEEHRRGEMGQALEQFQHSRATIIELHQREGNTQRALFELGQAEFYVGLVYFETGELDLAQQYWVRYGAITRRLVNAEPNNVTYVMELSYTLMNLGALEQSRPKPDASKSLQLIQTSIQYNQLALMLDPKNSVYRTELVTAVAWLADAWLEKCELGNAYKARKQSVDLRRELHHEVPGDSNHSLELAFMLSGLAGVQLQIGLNDAALHSFEEAVQLLSDLHLAEPDNADIEWEYIYRRQRMARLLMAMGELDTAWAITHPALERVELLSDPAENPDHFIAVEAAFFGLDYARLLLLRGETSKGEAKLRDATIQMAELVRQKPGYRQSLVGLTGAYFTYWNQFGEKPADTISNLLDGYLSEPDEVESCSDASLAARLAIMNGDVELAKSYTHYLRGNGYFEADFISFCREFRLCEMP